MRFDAPMGCHVLDDGIIELVEDGGLADQAGVTAKHVITAVNDAPVGAGMDHLAMANLLRERPVRNVHKQSSSFLRCVDPL